MLNEEMVALLVGLGRERLVVGKNLPSLVANVTFVNNIEKYRRGSQRLGFST